MGHKTAIHHAVFALPDPALAIRISAPALRKQAWVFRNPAPALRTCDPAIQSSVFVLLVRVRAIYASVPAIREQTPWPCEQPMQLEAPATHLGGVSSSYSLGTTWPLVPGSSGLRCSPDVNPMHPFERLVTSCRWSGRPYLLPGRPMWPVGELPPVATNYGRDFQRAFT